MNQSNNHSDLLITQPLLKVGGKLPKEILLPSFKQVPTKITINFNPPKYENKR